MKFEDKEKTIKVNTFSQKVFFVLLLFIFVFMSVGFYTEEKFNPLTIVFVFSFITLLLIHIFNLSRWSWYALIFNWLVLIIFMYHSMWEYDSIIHYSDHELSLGDILIVLSIVSIPLGTITFFLFYFNPNNKRYNKRLNPTAK